MQRIKLIPVLFALFLAVSGNAQTISYETVDIKSYDLYSKGNWTELLSYGKEALAQKQDFLYLRLRLGYAAYMSGNFSAAIKHYERALGFDKQNETAQYYLWLCNSFLNRRDIADAQAPHLSQASRDLLKLKPLSLLAIGNETSYKTADVIIRDNALYTRFDLIHRLGYRIHMQHSVVSYNQTIAEPLFVTVTKNDAIKINESGYYNRTSITLTPHWQLIGAYHYLKTPFNNYSYNNSVALAGVKYVGAFFEVQANGLFTSLTDTSRNQFDLKIGLYPKGNMNIYTFSTFMYRTKVNSGFNFKQVAGFKVLKNTWLELNATVGEFKNLVENDGLYIYNAVDINKFKGGATVYFAITTHLLAQAGYTYEQRQLYGRNQNFNQQSITGGLSWKF